MRVNTSQLVPPELFGIVEDGVMRSTVPERANHDFVRTLGLRSVLYLSQDHLSKELASLFDELAIRVRMVSHNTANHYPYASPLSENSVKDALEFILDVRNHPVLVMCVNGMQETGIIVGCLRKLEQWNFNSISCEYRSYAGIKGRTMVEHYINLFDLDLLNLPATLPEWYEYHRKLLEEEKAAYIANSTQKTQP